MYLYLYMCIYVHFYFLFLPIKDGILYKLCLVFLLLNNIFGDLSILIHREFLHFSFTSISYSTVCLYHSSFNQSPVFGHMDCF